jgi:hypothetical protein
MQRLSANFNYPFLFDVATMLLRIFSISSKPEKLISQSKALHFIKLSA